MSAQCKASCLYSDVREQDSTGGNIDDRTLLTLLNLRSVGSSDPPDSNPKSSHQSDSLGLWNMTHLTAFILLISKQILNVAYISRFNKTQSEN